MSNFEPVHSQQVTNKPTPSHCPGWQRKSAASAITAAIRLSLATGEPAQIFPLKDGWTLCQAERNADGLTDQLFDQRIADVYFETDGTTITQFKPINN